MFELEKQAPTGPTLMTTIEQSGNRCQTISLHSSCRYCLLVYFWCRHFFHWRDNLTEQAPDHAPRVITTAAGSERLSINATDTDWPLPGPVATDWFPSPPLSWKLPVISFNETCRQRNWFPIFFLILIFFFKLSHLISNSVKYWIKFKNYLKINLKLFTFFSVF